jgi:FkbM family methyltransferase
MLEGASRHSGIPIRIAGYDLLVDPSFVSKRWDEVEVENYRAYADAVKKAEVIYDVGAHIGTYSMLALKAGPRMRKVVAYEPHEFTRGLLRRHLEWNQCTGRAIVRDCCCGARKSEALFYGDPGKAEGDNGLLPAEGAPHTVVQVVTLDQEVEQLGLAPSLIKIDVEGAEFQVLQGCESTLALYSPVLFLSVHEAALAQLNLTPQTIRLWLEARGYGWETIATDHEMHVIATK